MIDDLFILVDYDPELNVWYTSYTKPEEGLYIGGVGATRKEAVNSFLSLVDNYEEYMKSLIPSQHSDTEDDN